RHRGSWPQSLRRTTQLCSTSSTCHAGRAWLSRRSERARLSRRASPSSLRRWWCSAAHWHTRKRAKDGCSRSPRLSCASSRGRQNQRCSCAVTPRRPSVLRSTFVGKNRTVRYRLSEIISLLIMCYRCGMCAGELHFETSEKQQRPASARQSESRRLSC
ncbi:hypothetical protein T492DRAFT_933098, partial [Pavlovales sp. CCMP2436]